MASNYAHGVMVDIPLDNSKHCILRCWCKKNITSVSDCVHVMFMVLQLISSPSSSKVSNITSVCDPIMYGRFMCTVFMLCNFN